MSDMEVRFWRQVISGGQKERQGRGKSMTFICPKSHSSFLAPSPHIASNPHQLPSFTWTLNPPVAVLLPLEWRHTYVARLTILSLYSRQMRNSKHGKGQTRWIHHGLKKVTLSANLQAICMQEQGGFIPGKECYTFRTLLIPCMTSCGVYSTGINIHKPL